MNSTKIVTKNLMNVIQPWEIKIRRVENGFIVSQLNEVDALEDEDEPTYSLSEIIFEDGSGINEIAELSTVNRNKTLSTKVAMYYLMIYLMGEFNTGYNKHEHANLEVKFEVVKENNNKDFEDIEF